MAGRYRLVVEVPQEAASVQVTAQVGAGGSLSASASVAVTDATRTTRVDPLQLVLGTSCAPSWQPTFGQEPGTDDDVLAIATHANGGETTLYVGGEFTTAGGAPANRVAKWDGAWSALGSGMNDTVRALVVHDLGDGPLVYAAGDFKTAFDSGDSYVAKWGCADLPPVLSCPSTVNAIDRATDGPGEVVSFTVTATDDFDPAPAVVCVPPSGSTFPRGTTLVTCTATDAAGNESTRQFPVTVTLKVGQRGSERERSQRVERRRVGAIVLDP